MVSTAAHRKNSLHIIAIFATIVAAFNLFYMAIASALFYRLLRLQRRHLLGWSATIPRMVTHHPMNGYLPSKIYQKEL